MVNNGSFCNIVAGFPHRQAMKKVRCKRDKLGVLSTLFLSRLAFHAMGNDALILMFIIVVTKCIYIFWRSA